MSYQSQAQLQGDVEFNARCRASITQRSDIFKDDERANYKALANSLLRSDNPSEFQSFISLLANSPGFADKVDNGDGTVDASKIEDAELQAAVDFQFPIVAGLYYDSSGSPIVPVL